MIPILTAGKGDHESRKDRGYYQVTAERTKPGDWWRYFHSIIEIRLSLTCKAKYHWHYKYGLSFGASLKPLYIGVVPPYRRASDEIIVACICRRLISTKKVQVLLGRKVIWKSSRVQGKPKERDVLKEFHREISQIIDQLGSRWVQAVLDYNPPHVIWTTDTFAYSC